MIVQQVFFWVGFATLNRPVKMSAGVRTMLGDGVRRMREAIADIWCA